MNKENKANQDEEVIEESEKQDTAENVVDETTSINEEDIEIVDEEEADVQEDDHLEQKLAEATNRLLRVQADYDNFRRRTKVERESDAKYRSQNLIEKLLPVLDNFERALMLEPESEEAKQLLEGTEMVYKQLQDALTEEGVEIIETVGNTFDPHKHQAVMQVEEEGKEKDEIVAELQKGYLLKDRVIRPSMVKVNS